MSVLKRGINLFKNQGLKSFIRKSILYTKQSLDYPNILSILKVKKYVVKINDLDSAIDFVFSENGALIKPGQVKSEIQDALKYSSKLILNNILEIGTANGGSLFLLSRIASDDAKVISLDLRGGKFGGGYPFWKKSLYLKFRRLHQRMELLRDNSHSLSSLSKVKKILNNNKLDLLFIDGDHSYEGVKRDFELYSPLVRKGGIVIFHDITIHINKECDVSKFWSEVKKKYKNKEFVEDKNQGWAGIGLIIKD